MRKLRLSYVIHLFALLHGAVCMGCALVGVQDAVLLTLMTMILTVIICTRRRLSVDVMAFGIILVNVVGFLLGTSFARVFDHFLQADWAPHTIATFLTTEALGWSLYWLTQRLPHRWYIHSYSGRIGILIFAILGVFLVRMAVNLKTQGYFVEDLDLSPSLIADILAGMVVLFFAIVLYGLAIQEREQGHRADLRYATLKNLVNPHFLFNSLNILDGLIAPDNAAAKDYLRRLSALYRYMTVHEKEDLVHLDDERSFARNYIALLSIRFPDAIQVSVNVRDEELHTRIVPCSLQILIENAIKHNAISNEAPLLLEISSEKGWLIIRNNIRPRTSTPPSTGVGLHYIQTRYNDLSERELEVVSDEHFFTVRVPLID